MNESKKNIFKLGILYLYFFLGAIVVSLLLQKFNIINPKNDYNKALLILNIVFDYTLFILCALLLRKKILTDFKEIKKDKLTTTISDLIYFIIMGYITVQLFNICCTLLGSSIGSIFGISIEEANNQSILEEMIKLAPVNMFLTVCIIGPFSEEVIFRGAVGEVIKNKRVFITVSGLIFGLMHVSDSVGLMVGLLLMGIVINTIIGKENLSYSKKLTLSILVIIGCIVTFLGYYQLMNGHLIKTLSSIEPSELVSAFSYVGMGFGLGYIYIKNDKNIAKNICLHCFINTLAFTIALF